MTKEKETTLLQAIAMAGGFTDHANIDGTKVMRIKNGEKETIIVKVRDIINKGDTDKDIFSKLLKASSNITMPFFNFCAPCSLLPEQFDKFFIIHP